MKIKKYIADTFSEGKNRILSELGDEAVILSTRNTKKANGQDIVEIVAAIDEKDLENKVNNQRPVKDKLSGLESMLNEIRPKKNSQNRVATYEGKGELYDHIFDIKNQINELGDAIKYRHSGTLGKVFGKLYKELVRNEVSEELTLEICGKISSSNPSIKFDEAMVEARHILCADLEINHPLKKTDKRQVIVFTGPTGGGKTMSLVKVAIISKLVLNANIMIISADHFKVGGADQLQTYSSIAGIPFKSVYSNKELKNILTSNQDVDFIFVDTIGSSQREADMLNEVSDIIKICKADRVMLCQSAVASSANFRNVLENYISLSPSDIILTKLDEAVAIGGIVSILKEFKIPLTYLSYGQKVPDDLEPASRKLIGKITLGEKGTIPNIKDLIK